MRIFYIFFTLVLFTCSCLQIPPEAPPMTQLQVRAVQTREFDTTDIKLVTKSVMHVLQDEGFIIKNAVLDLGLVNAEKYIEKESPYHNNSHYHNSNNDQYGDIQFSLSSSRSRYKYSRNQHQTRDEKPVQPRYEVRRKYEASVNISEHGAKTRVRANFQITKIDNNSNPLSVKAILDQKYYQNFFDKVGKGIFIQESEI